MAEKAKARVEARDFPGMIEGVDVEDLPPGAAEEQVNMTSLVPGEMSTRRGYRQVQFEE